MKPLAIGKKHGKHQKNTENIKKNVEKELEKCREVSETVYIFLKKHDIPPFLLAMLIVIEKQGNCKSTDITKVFAGGLHMLGRTYAPNEKSIPVKISQLRKKGYLDIHDTVITLSPVGKQLLTEFRVLIETKIEESQKPKQKETHAEQITALVANHLHTDLQGIAQHYPDTRSIYIDFLQLEKDNLDLAEGLLSNPDEFISATENAICDLNIIISPDLEEKEFKPHVRIRNLPEAYSIPIKNITSFFSQNMSPLFTCEGVITSKCDVLSKASLGRFKCVKCDEYYNEPQPTRNIRYPVPCKVCRSRDYKFLPDESEWIDVQRMEIQEAFDSLEMGEQTRSIELWVEDDLCDAVEIGEHVVVTGISRLLPPKKKGLIYSRFVEVLSIEKTEESLDIYNLTGKEKKEIMKLGRNPQIHTLIRESIAPSIHGHDEVKEALALQLFGGRPGKKNAEGIPERSLIHILLIGEPGTGKSRLMRLVARLAPKYILASGRGASGCGLTATVTKDEMNKDRWVVKAGAMLLANGGFLGVDEFDKMNPNDQVSMNEGMASQEIPITKAGIVTKLKADTIILAAANPKFSRFDLYKPLSQQFNLDESLLSRFDLVFPFLDSPDSTADRRIAEKIIQSHSHLPDEEKADDTEVIPSELLRKYIAFAKQNYSPILSEESMNELVDTYISLRQDTEARMVTPRQLGGLIRLAEASAKLRLSNTVNLDDVHRAVRIYTTALRMAATDPETGKIDIDRIYTSHPASTRQKIKTIEEIIQECSRETGEASIATVLTKAQKQNIPDDECRKILMELKKKGILYEPRHNTLKLV